MQSDRSVGHKLLLDNTPAEALGRRRAPKFDAFGRTGGEVRLKLATNRQSLIGCICDCVMLVLRHVGFETPQIRS